MIGDCMFGKDKEMEKNNIICTTLMPQNKTITLLIRPSQSQAGFDEFPCFHYRSKKKYNSSMDWGHAPYRYRFMRAFNRSDLTTKTLSMNHPVHTAQVHNDIIAFIARFLYFPRKLDTSSHSKPQGSSSLHLQQFLVIISFIKLILLKIRVRNVKF
jgi:hypothetical protein